MERATGLIERVVIGLLVVLVVVAGFALLHQGSDHRATRGGSASTGTGASTYVAERALPATARAVVRTVRAGGPFPNSGDGAVYPNGSHRLPTQPAGFYHRYGVSGAAAVVQGQDGTIYYTADGSRFRQVQQ